ncbi:MAG TPA: hypothetical protein IAC46_01125 [Candidatus Onthoplasma faecigallinarum]|nr:hypothetical protein [Candidatus Onthoplasma faecigallinarum]
MKEKVIRNYIERDGKKLKIIKASNGKYFNVYTTYGAGAGPFKTFKEAEIALYKHRPTAEKISKKTIKLKFKK